MARVAMSESFIDALAALDSGDAKRTASFLEKMTHAENVSAFRPEKVHSSPDRTIRSLRVTKDLRAIAHVSGDEWLLLYVARHDVAYAWARDKCVMCHPVTGELQVVADPHRAEGRLATWEQPREPGLFDDLTDRYLLSIGTPPEWIPTLRQIKSEEMFLAVAGDLPAGIAERLMRVATGELVPPRLRPESELAADADEHTESWICTVGDADTLCRLLDDRGIPHERFA
ncbi:MAG: hypothetical protein HY876_05625 [Coriobacteriales bacterium]|nr:hypothetical protein [Coriobacteriales bacterium]